MKLKIFPRLSFDNLLFSNNMLSILDTVLRVIASVRGNCLEESFIKIVFRLRGNTTRNSSDIAFLAFTQVKMTRNGELMRNRNTDRGEGKG